MGYLIEMCSSYPEPIKTRKHIEFQEDPESEYSIAFAEMILSYSSNGTAVFWDVESKCDAKTFYYLDEDEYRLHNGEYMYKVSRSMILGQSFLVRREHLKATNILDRICYPVEKQFLNIIEKIKKVSGNKTNQLNWNEDQTLFIFPETLEILRKETIQKTSLKNKELQSQH